MAILVTGSTGTIGAQVLAALDGQSDVRALTRSPEKAQFPAGITAVKGDLADVDSVRAALDGVSALFLLAPNAPDELTQAMLALNAARDAGIKGVVYLSVFKGAAYANVPHFIGKAAVERMIEGYAMPVTVLRPAYFIQNDLTIKDVITGYGVYPMPVGTKGLAMIDVRDIAEIAAIELLRRERAAQPLPTNRINLVGPDTLTGTDIAAIWSDVLGRQINYGGGDTAAFEQNLKQFMPPWMAYDMRMMGERFLTHGMLPEGGDVERLTTLLGRPLCSYRDFAKNTRAAA